MSNHNKVEFATKEGITYETSLTDFANRHNLTNDEFLRGSGRTHRATGGNVEATGTMPNWAQGEQQQGANTGGKIRFEWKGGSNNKRIIRKDGGTVMKKILGSLY